MSRRIVTNFHAPPKRETTSIAASLRTSIIPPEISMKVSTVAGTNLSPDLRLKSGEIENWRSVMANNELDRRSAEIADTVEEDKVIRKLCHVVRYQRATLYFCKINPDKKL